MVAESRTLSKPPLVEYIVEFRWSGLPGRQSLYDDYRFGLGRLFEHLRTQYPEKSGLTHLPELFYAGTTPPPLVPFDRFQPASTDRTRLAYPLVQYGPGIATLNADGPSYSWPDVKARSISLWHALCETHTALPERIDAIILRSIDLFPIPNPMTPLRFLADRLQTPVSSKLMESKHLGDATLSPAVAFHWKLPASTIGLRANLSEGEAFGQHGLLLNLVCEAGRPDLARGFPELLDRMHAILGDSFFDLISDSLKKELHDESN